MTALEIHGTKKYLRYAEEKGYYIASYRSVINYLQDENFRKRAGVYHREGGGKRGVYVFTKSPKVFLKALAQKKIREMIKTSKQRAKKE